MKKYLLVLPVAFTSGLAMAATDVTATTTSIGEAATAALAIGVAVTAVVVAIKLYKWVQRAI